MPRFKQPLLIAMSTLLAGCGAALLWAFVTIEVSGNLCFQEPIAFIRYAELVIPAAILLFGIICTWYSIKRR